MLHHGGTYPSHILPMNRTKRSPSRSPSKGMATVRRLSDADVRAIFECLHETRPPPPHLKFSIVPVPVGGLKLSPPSFEFSDGLYVLLRPAKKRKNQVECPKAPEHLTDLVISDLLPSTCPWSLSGPQFPQPTAIQQRYCYPKGRPEYSSRKGGALWTMYGADGKEDLEFRLLHVYFSAKRAVNKGVSIPEEEMVAASPAKRTKRSPMRSPHRMASPHRHLQQSPAITTSSVSHSSLCSSPLSFDMLPPPSPGQKAALQHMPCLEQQSNFVSPPSDTFLHRRFHPLEPNFMTSSPFRHNIQQSPLTRSTAERESMEPFELDSSLQEIDQYWNDPLLNIMLKPSQDAIEKQPPKPEPVRSFVARLETLHESIREIILAAPVAEQPALVSLLAAWARQIAKDPLTDLHQAASQEQRSAAGKSEKGGDAARAAV